MKSIISRVLAALLCGLGPTNVRAEQAEGNPRDVLVYKDGDRVQGRLVDGTKKEVIVFHSDRFGELRVPADQAVVIKAEPVVTPGPGTAQGASGTLAAQSGLLEKKAAAQAEAMRVSGWERFSPAVLAARLRDYFGPWHGHLALSSEVVSDTADRSNFSAEAQLKRKWQADEVQLNGRMDYSKTNALTTTDVVKGDGLWRHDFNENSFVQYRPTLEWNRANFRAGLPADYVLLQQEIGAGLSLAGKPGRKLRVGLSENLFKVWNTSPPTTQSARTSESAFLETELKLPWGMLLTDRSVYYYSFSSGRDGWENRVEVTKKFTETLSTAVRHEVRHGSPDGTAQDYTRLKLLVGLDF